MTTLLVTHFVHKTEYGQTNLALIIATVVNVLTLLAPQRALLTRRTLFAESSQIIQRFVVGSGVLVFGLLCLVWAGRCLGFCTNRGRCRFCRSTARRCF